MQGFRVGSALSIALSLSFSSAMAGECASGGSQAFMNDCAERSFKKIDAALNTVYRQIIVRLNNEPHIEMLLVSSEKAWISFRDAECKFATSPTVKGTIHGLLVAQCLEKLTSKRLTDLNEYSTCAENDISCPVRAR